MANPVRQGDLVFRPVKSINKSLIKLKTGKKAVLAIGEQSGHKHILDGVFEAFGDVTGTPGAVAVLERGATLTHDEHDSVTLDPGNYEIKQPTETSLIHDVAYKTAD